jgi:hypothetical protein
LMNCSSALGKCVKWTDSSVLSPTCQIKSCNFFNYWLSFIDNWIFKCLTFANHGFQFLPHVFRVEWREWCHQPSDLEQHMNNGWCGQKLVLFCGIHGRSLYTAPIQANVGICECFKNCESFYYYLLIF